MQDKLAAKHIIEDNPEYVHFLLSIAEYRP